MINLFQSLILGVVQGLAEFLPISSSAHLVLVPRFMGWPDPGLAFDVALHLGTLAAVLLYFRKQLQELALAFLEPRNPSRSADRRLVGYLALATIPGAIAGLLLEHKAESVFRSAGLIAWALIGMGTLMLAADYLSGGEKTLSQMTPGIALLLGVGQSLALIPGVSRAGITITLALFLGMKRADAARFSFLMSIPIIAGAGLLKGREIWLTPDKLPVFAGLAGAAVSGFFAIWLLLRYVQKHRYTPFTLYRWALGAFVLVNISRFNP